MGRADGFFGPVVEVVSKRRSDLALELDRCNEPLVLIDCIVLTPDDTEDGLLINLYGDLAGILNLAKADSDAPETEETLRHIRLVSGLAEQVNPLQLAQAGSGGARKGMPGRQALSLTSRATPKGGKLVGPAGLEPATRPL